MNTIFDLSSLDDLILLKIFSYLSIRDLKSSMQVCLKFNKLIQEIIDKRKRNVKTILFNSHQSNTKTKQIEYERFKKEINNELAHLMTQPDIFVFFLTKHMTKNCIHELIMGSEEEESEGRAKRLRRSNIEVNKMRADECLSKLLPKSSKKLYIYSDGVIGTNALKNKTVEIESTFNQPSLAGLVLPKCHDSFRFSFKFLKKQEQLAKFKSEQELFDYFDVKSGEEDIKFMFLSVHDSYIQIDEFINNLNNLKQKPTNLNFPVSGAFVVSTEMDDSSDKDNLIAFMLLTCRKNETSDVKVCQFVIPDSKKNDFEYLWNKKVDLVKKTDTLNDTNGRSLFALQVSCVARGVNFHKTENFESSLFSKTFPNIPVVGLFGYGEFGFDYLPGVDLNDFKSDKKVPNDLPERNLRNLSYSTVMTIISLKN